MLYTQLVKKKKNSNCSTLQRNKKLHINEFSSCWRLTNSDPQLFFIIINRCVWNISKTYFLLSTDGILRMLDLGLGCSVIIPVLQCNTAQVYLIHLSFCTYLSILVKELNEIMYIKYWGHTVWHTVSAQYILAIIKQNCSGWCLLATKFSNEIPKVFSHPFPVQLSSRSEPMDEWMG